MSCQACNTSKAANRPLKFPQIMNQAGIPMATIHIDYLGPLPLSHKGNSYILVMVDSFTKWTEIIALPDQKAETTARALVDNVFSRLGYPGQIISDNGACFVSNLFTEMCRLLRIKRNNIIPGRPSANGMVERRNRDIMNAIRCFIGKDKRNWDENLQLIALGLRSAVNRHINFTANEMMLGRQIETPAELMVPHSKFTPKYAEDYVNELRENFVKAHETAREIMKSELKITKRNNDLHSRQFMFKEGDIIYMLNRGMISKMAKKWIGPGIILKVYSSNILQVTLNNGRSTLVTNHNFLKTCIDRDIPGWIKKKQQQIKEKTAKYCLCNRTDNNELMIQCFHCLEWYHGGCVNLSKTEIRNARNFCCPRCKKLE